jgi:hypothetical protein
MGWELKMPDTALTDTEFIENASKKASILNLNAFMLWNAQSAVLYLLEDKEYKPVKNWNTSCGVIFKREDVSKNRKSWIEALHNILKDLNNFFESGTIKRKPLIESFKENRIIEFILRDSLKNADVLQDFAKTDGRFSAEANLWWRVSKYEYPNHKQWEILAEIVLVNWINKILFANILTAFYDDSKLVYKIDMTTNPEQAVDIFEKISKTCDFWNIFQPHIGEKFITKEAWSEIVQLNLFLKDIELTSISQELLQDLLEHIVYATKRKVAGQYTTPIKLSRFLVHLTMLNKKGTIHDPCCGTGTIARAVYDIKKEAKISASDALSTIFASDKVSFPLQMATLAISEPENIGRIIQIFKQDLTDIKVGQSIELRDPYDGSKIDKEYLKVSHIVSNLPFIQQEDLKVLNPHIKTRTNTFIKEKTGQNIALNAKSDLYAYLPFYLWELLEDNGRVGIIVSNSWLGTQWGAIFKKALSRFFKIEYIVTSGKGRWFHNADVVTNIVILEKRSSSFDISNSELTNFITLNQDINHMNNDDIEKTFEDIITKTKNDNFVYQEYKTIDLIDIPLNWNALFSDISWLKEVEDKLIFSKELFDINRGERRGWNKMFYPEQKHTIEADFIKPVLRTPKHIKTLIARAETDAFCCSLSEQELMKKGYKGALSWINRFKNGFNTKGKSLPKVLHKEGYYWYEMNDSTMADLVSSMNFNHRIFIAKLETRSFVDQRLTRFTALNDDLDIDLAHALLNSILGIFFIEAIGFGRGQGVLDLSSTRMKNFLKMLNPNLLKQKQILEIKEKFAIFRDRESKNILEELQELDRNEFDNVVLKAYGIAHLKDKIINSFLYLYKIRTTVIAPQTDNVSK